MYGKGIRSERPIIMEIPYDEEKKKANEELNYNEGDLGD